MQVGKSWATHSCTEQAQRRNVVCSLYQLPRQSTMQSARRRRRDGMDQYTRVVRIARLRERIRASRRWMSAADVVGLRLPAPDRINLHERRSHFDDAGHSISPALTSGGDGGGIYPFLSTENLASIRGGRAILCLKCLAAPDDHSNATPLFRGNRDFRQYPSGSWALQRQGAEAPAHPCGRGSLQSAVLRPQYLSMALNPFAHAA